MTAMAGLPDEPNVWGKVDTLVEGYFWVRWLPGAFGDRTNIEGVKVFRVSKEEWDFGDDNEIPRRTIIEAEVVV